MKLTYNLLLTDVDIIHECVQTTSDISDVTMCGHETKDLRKEFGPHPTDDNFRVVSTSVTCIDCLAATDDQRKKQLLKGRITYGGDFYP